MSRPRSAVAALVRALARLVSAAATLVEACARLVDAVESRVAVPTAPKRAAAVRQPAELPAVRLAALPPPDDAVVLALRKLGFTAAEAAQFAARAEGDTTGKRLSSALRLSAATRG